jgi:hypothetical protein
MPGAWLSVAATIALGATLIRGDQVCGMVRGRREAMPFPQPKSRGGGGIGT